MGGGCRINISFSEDCVLTIRANLNFFFSGSNLFFESISTRWNSIVNFPRGLELQRLYFGPGIVFFTSYIYADKVFA